MEAATIKRGIRHCNGKCVQACTSAGLRRTERVRFFAKWTGSQPVFRGIAFALQGGTVEGAMAGQWKLICKLKDVPLDGVRRVPRGLAWQELPGVALFRTGEEHVHAVLECHGVDPRYSSAHRYSVKVESCRVYLDLAELSAPASKAEAALAGTFGVATSMVAYCY
jgi:nitrite reductase (NADH) small subunit